MKRFSILGLALLLGLFVTACDDGKSSAEEAKDIEVDMDNLPEFKWGDGSEEAMTHDFGKMKQGEVVEHTYTFENVGKGDLKIHNVKPSCGCTVPEYTEDPIKPGGTGKIKIKFDSDGKSGKQNKAVTVLANTDPRATKLKFTAEIEE
mgnify:CR=1 FL=1